MKKILAAALCCCAVALSAAVSAISASAVKTKCDTYEGSNAEQQNYSTWSAPVESYLTKSSSGGLMRVQGDAVSGKILVEYYDSSYNITSTKEISAELPIFGGFYETADNYYILSGQNNPDEKDTVEVYRITKYNKSWKKISSCGLRGANTYIPFDAGSARMTDDGKYLLIRTCHEMYTSNDGRHHQANVTIQVDMDKMEITDHYTGVMNSAYGYVSHSFNQFIKAENGHIIAVDHGDAYPRSILLTEYTTDYTSGSFTPDCDSSCTVTDLLEFPGSIGDNYTGASVGGFEISDSSYIVAGNYVGDSSYGSSNTRNIFVASLSKTADTDRQPAVNMITNYTSGTTSTPHLVKVAENSYLLLWSRDGKVYYTRIDGSGKKSGSTYSMDGKLSDCVPLLYNNKLVWYVWENETVTFYSINAKTISSHSKTVINNGHQFTTKVAANSNIATQTCSVCGTQRKIKVLTDYWVYWSKNSDRYFYSVCDKTYHPGDTLELWVNYDDSVDNDDMVYEISNESAAQLSGDKYSTMAMITMKEPGTFTLKIYPRYNTSNVQKYTFTVEHDYDSGKITKSPTCSATGVRTYTCKNCGAKKTSSIAKTAHSYDTGKVTKSPTCTATGVRTYTCKNCGAKKTTTIAKTAHSYDTGKVTKSPTCTATGVRTYTCKNCGAKKTTAIAKTAHSYDSGKITKSPTYASAGTRTYTCKKCGAKKTTAVAKKTVAKLTAKTDFTYTTNAVRINWNKMSGVTGYKVFRYDEPTKKWVAVKAIYDPNATNYRIDGLAAGKVHKFRVKAFVKENGKVYFGESCNTISTATRPVTTKITKNNKASTAVRLFWNKVECSGYRILRFDEKSGKWVRVTAVEGSSTTQYRISGLKKNTSYKYRVQPYVRVGSKVIYGTASATYTAKTTK